MKKVDDQTQSNPTFQMHSKELTPNPRKEDGKYLDHTGLNSETHKNLATIGYVKVSERKDTTQDATMHTEKKVAKATRTQKMNLMKKK